MKTTSLTSYARYSFALLLGAVAAAAFACSAGGAPNQSGVTGSTGTGSGASTGSGATTGTGSGGGTSTGTGGTINVPDPTDPDSGRPLRCDDAGNCTCINVGVLGRMPTYGAGGADTTIALQTWLNDKSSAAVDLVTTKPTITPEWLANYDVLVLQALETAEGQGYWTFTPDELAAFEAWVRAGGGVITLTGYGGQPAEVDPTNQLLAFTGMSYNKDDVLFTCPAAENGCCYCAGAAVPMGGWTTHPIGLNITYVGAFHGRSVNPGTGTVVAQEGALVYGATADVDMGHVFMFTDEWVTYTSQWNSTGTECANLTDVNHSCYGKSPDQYFQVQQFWYNSLLWASGNRECFDIDDMSIVK